MSRAPLDLGGYAVGAPVSGQLIHNRNGGARVYVRTPFGVRTMPYPFGAHGDPVVAAILEAFGGSVRLENVTGKPDHRHAVAFPVEVSA